MQKKLLYCKRGVRYNKKKHSYGENLRVKMRRKNIKKERNNQ